MPNFNLKTVDFWRKIEKQAQAKQTNIVKTRTDAVNITTPLQTFILSISTIRALKSI